MPALPYRDSSSLASLTYPQLALRLFRHLRAMEHDADYNTPRPGQGTLPFWRVNVRPYSNHILVQYASYEAPVKLPPSQARAYLAWLEAGHRGRHTDLPTETAPQP